MDSATDKKCLIDILTMDVQLIERAREWWIEFKQQSHCILRFCAVFALYFVVNDQGLNLLKTDALKFAHLK